MASGTNGPPLHSRLLQKLNRDVPTDWPSHSIFKVPNHLRRISKQAYDPQVISIGPYHHGKGQLKKMEVYKMCCLKKLLVRRTERSLERYLTALKDMEEKAREFYSEPLNHIGGEKFVEMMLLDGCFIIELIRKSTMGENDLPFAPFFSSRAMLDLLLVENQLPFFILLKLFDMTVMSNDQAKDFKAMAIKFFSKIMPGSLGIPKNQDIKHLLGLLHDSSQAPSPDFQEVRIFCLPEKVIRSQCPEVELNCCSSEVVRSSPPEPQEDQEIELAEADQEIELAENEQEIEIGSRVPISSRQYCRAPSIAFPSPASSEEILGTAVWPASLVGFWPFNKLRLWCKRAPDANSKEWRFISSATELNEAGINFKKIKGRLFDIKFQKGVMSIPTLSVNDHTESILRNLVVYEQCFEGTSSKCFTDYLIFMDCLINKGKDVKLLCRHRVIDNWLGDHVVVATLFNKVHDSVFISKDNFSYAGLFIEVNKHCKRKWNLWKANLWHNYFNTPWAVISFFGAVFLLLLSVLESVFEIRYFLQ
ncbi:hypothetical protein SLEP1_g57087 [Rubroshorea leprosula]|uniref:Uncharacterized protein n=1 Tax=Rubroshorea leprosula TaxID=152421 RepID=A0AAV5MKF1_9ROSI|nr:hypothetical protein SLEP1_g57087 [Rubroshorea leprosula]